MQKEFKQLLTAIDRWRKANDDVYFIGAFVSIDLRKAEKDEDDITKDNILLGYGEKDTIEIMLNELTNQLKKDKRAFINW